MSYHFTFYWRLYSCEHVTYICEAINDSLLSDVRIMRFTVNLSLTKFNWTSSRLAVMRQIYVFANWLASGVPCPFIGTWKIFLWLKVLSRICNRHHICLCGQYGDYANHVWLWDATSKSSQQSNYCLFEEIVTNRTPGTAEILHYAWFHGDICDNFRTGIKHHKPYLSLRKC